MKVDITLYEWWLSNWQDNNINCAFWVDHEGLPYDSDVLSACGQSLYDRWKEHSTPCDNDKINECKGFYLILVKTKPSQKEVSVILPPPEVFVSVEDCNPAPDGWCTGQPALILTGKEPLPNESIRGIQGFIGSDAFTCEGPQCKFNLKETAPHGIRIQFWANSTYGDSSKIFTALLRVSAEKASGERLTPRLYVDVLSTQWIGPPVASCAQAWEAFPPTDGLPEWLTSPKTSDDLESNIPYAYLAGNLISQGVVNASACADKGLLPGGTASACGLEVAKPAVTDWQNRFDKLIFKVSKKNEFPAQLLKNLFSRESQFWPGVFRNSDDVGLGQLTDGGADTMLLWNPSFYSQFCPLILTERVCNAKGYANLKPKQQSLLRGALIGSVDARCTDCPLGLDLSRADFSVEIFVHTLMANCEQAGKIVENITGQAPGQTVSYEDMWRFTLVNYNAGPGCLSTAMQKVHETDSGAPLNWDKVSAAFDETCQTAVRYVGDISQVAGKPPPTPTPTKTPVPTATPTP
jgi:hypothetical protein